MLLSDVSTFPHSRTFRGPCASIPGGWAPNSPDNPAPDVYLCSIASSVAGECVLIARSGSLSFVPFWPFTAAPGPHRWTVRTRGRCKDLIRRCLSYYAPMDWTKAITVKSERYAGVAPLSHISHGARPLRGYVLKMAPPPMAPHIPP
eukprot:688458-Prorocentrum_minimum.AAC.2